MKKFKKNSKLLVDYFGEQNHDYVHHPFEVILVRQYIGGVYVKTMTKEHQFYVKNKEILGEIKSNQRWRLK